MAAPTEPLLGASRAPPQWLGLPIEHKARPLFPPDERLFRQTLEPVVDPTVFSISGQFGIIPVRSQPSRHIGRRKDMAEFNRKDYRGDGVVYSSNLAAKRRRTELYNSRKNNV